MNRFLPRLLNSSIEIGLESSPVVVITGARQTGKSTLAQKLDPEKRSYFSLDDFEVRAQAEKTPDDLVRRAPRMVIDEVQRVPDLLMSVKRAVDEDRMPGRYVLTGSANLLLMSRISESLAGRAVYYSLLPFTRRETLGSGRSGLWSELFEKGEDDWPDLIDEQDTPHENWEDLVRVGGYPVPVVELDDRKARGLWFDGYTQTYLERDLQDLSAIENLVDFKRLMTACSLRLGQLINQSELGRDVGLPQPTVRRYLNLLETSCQLVRIPVYAVNRTKRLIKTPKLYWNDVGLAFHLSGMETPSGSHLENLVLTDLLAWQGAMPRRAEILYWRTTTGEEVDFVIEVGGSVLPIEIKSGSRVRFSDTAGLRAFRSEYPDLSRAGLLLYDGQKTAWLAPGILAAPWWKVI